MYANTLDELRKIKEKIIKEMVNGISCTNITLNEQIELYLKVKSKLAISTKENYRYYSMYAIMLKTGMCIGEYDEMNKVEDKRNVRWDVPLFKIEVI